MYSKIRIILLLLAPVYCWAQSVDTLLVQKAFHEDISYLENLRQGSSNPAMIHYAPFDVLEFNIHNFSSKDHFGVIDAPLNSRYWNGDISGVQKLENIVLQGGLQYSNQKQMDVRWKSSLFLAPDNPFFACDSFPGDASIETIKLNGGFSWELNPKWRTGIRAFYHVGGLADQADPRPLTQSMRFYFIPGAEVRWDKWSLGFSAGICFFSEETKFVQINGRDPSTSFIFLSRGLGDQEYKTTEGNSPFQRRTTGNRYLGSLQLVWDNHSDRANYLQLEVAMSTEEAIDGERYTKYRGGDYQQFYISLSDRFRIITGNYIQNITLNAVMRDVSGTWFLQTMVTGSDGNTVWEIRDQSVCHTSNEIEASLAYRIDMMKGSLPSLTFDLKGGMLIADVRHFPQEYYRTYTNAFIDAEVRKHFNINRNLFSLSVNGYFQTNLDADIHVTGSRLANTVQIPQFHALSADFFGAGAGASFKVPVTVRNQPLWLGFFANASFYKYNGDYEKFLDTSRNFVKAGVQLVF